MKGLLTAGIDASINYGSPDLYLLDAASVIGYVEVMRALLEHGVDVNDVSLRGFTELQCIVLYSKANLLVDVIDLHLSAVETTSKPQWAKASRPPIWRSNGRLVVTSLLLQREAP